MVRHEINVLLCRTQLKAEREVAEKTDFSFNNFHREMMKCVLTRRSSLALHLVAYMFIYCVSFECLPSRVCNSRLLLLYVCFMDDEDFNFFLTRRFDSLRWWFCDECVGELPGIIVMMGFVSEFWTNFAFFILCVASALNSCES